jgi:hypothetical protein
LELIKLAENKDSCPYFIDKVFQKLNADMYNFKKFDEEAFKKIVLEAKTENSIATRILYGLFEYRGFISSWLSQDLEILIKPILLEHKRKNFLTKLIISFNWETENLSLIEEAFKDLIQGALFVLKENDNESYIRHSSDVGELLTREIFFNNKSGTEDNFSLESLNKAFDFLFLAVQQYSNLPSKIRKDLASLLTQEKYNEILIDVVEAVKSDKTDYIAESYTKILTKTLTHTEQCSYFSKQFSIQDRQNIPTLLLRALEVCIKHLKSANENTQSDDLLNAFTQSLRNLHVIDPQISKKILEEFLQDTQLWGRNPK